MMNRFSPMLRLLLTLVALTATPLDANAGITDHPDADSTWRSLEIQARLLHDEGRYREAISLRKNAIKLADTFGQNNRWLAESINNLGLEHLALGEYIKAESLITEALNMRVLKFGSSHEDVAESYSNLGALRLTLDEAEEATKLFKKSLQILEHSPTVDSSEYVIGLNNLAASYSRSGQGSEAKELYLKAIEVSRRLEGSLTVENVTMIINLAGQYLADDDLDSARMLIDQADSLVEHADFDARPDRAPIYGLRAQLFLALDDIERAKAEYRNGAEIIAQTVGNKHQDYGQMLLALGLLEMSDGTNLNESRKNIEQSYSIFRSTLKPSHQLVAQSASVLLLIHIQLGEQDKATAIYAELFADVIEEYGAGSYEHIGLVSNLVRAHMQFGDLASSEVLSLQLAEFAEAPSKTDNETLAFAMQTLLQIYFQQERYEEALVAAERSIEALERSRGRASASLLTPLDYIVKLYELMSDSLNSEKTHRRILYIANRSYSNNDRRLAPYLKSYSKFLRKSGRDSKADSLLALADSLSPPVDIIAEDSVSPDSTRDVR